MDWLTSLFDHDLWALGYSMWQAGTNMIPNIGWQQALEVWAFSKKD